MNSRIMFLIDNLATVNEGLKNQNSPLTKCCHKWLPSVPCLELYFHFWHVVSWGSIARAHTEPPCPFLWGLILIRKVLLRPMLLNLETAAAGHWPWHCQTTPDSATPFLHLFIHPQEILGAWSMLGEKRDHSWQDPSQQLAQNSEKGSCMPSGAAQP